MANIARLEEGADSDWIRAHEALSRLARERATADAEEGRWLVAARRAATHVHLGFASFGEYVERLFGYTRRSIQEKLRVAEALEELPSLGRALETGALGWSAVRELTRVAVPDTEREWLEVGQGKTLRQLEELVADKRPGDTPSAPSLPSPRRHVLRFEVAPETFALFREAITWLRRQSSEALDDDSALLSMARHVLGGPRDQGRASYQIALTICPACGGEQLASGRVVTVGADAVAMAYCDGQHLGRIAPHAANENARTDDTHVDARLETANPGPDAHVDARVETSDDVADADVDVRGEISDDIAGAHVDASVDAHSTVPVRRPHALASPRAKQTIPPAVRRTVLLRDRHRCRVPGCRNAMFLDLHHVQLRSEGGADEPANIITLCGAHHRAAHRGELLIDADASERACRERDEHGEVRFRHGDGTDYGQPLQPRAVGAQAKVFAALRNLGFREREVRAVLSELRQDDNLRDASSEQLLREALRRIRPHGARQ